MGKTSRVTFGTSDATDDANEQADILYFTSASRASGAADDYDLVATLTDALGATITIVDLTMIYVRNKNTTTGEKLVVGGDAAAPANGEIFADTSDMIVVNPAGQWYWSSPIDGAAITGGADTIQVNNTSGAAILYDIVFMGRSA